MRLERVRSGHRLKQKAVLALIRLVGRREPPDVVKTMFYRPELFGGSFSALLQGLMRGPSDWTFADRELFAAFTSKLNRCVF